MRLLLAIYGVDELITDLVAEVVVLNLDNGVSNSLETKLENALKVLEDVSENVYVADIDKLEAFVNHVQAQAGDKIPQADADDLIAAAHQITSVSSLLTQRAYG